MRIELLNINKKFKEYPVLDNISLTLDSGTIYGLSGRNGSGKTVLLKILCGLTKYDSGKILLNNVQVERDLKDIVNIGIVIENPGFIGELTGYENLKILSAIRNKIDDDIIFEWTGKLGLNKRDLSKKVNKYSMGMKQKLAIAQALMEDPKVIVLDEPMNSLDSATVVVLREILKIEKQNNKLIIIASHFNEDLENLCDIHFNIKEGHLSLVNKI